MEYDKEQNEGYIISKYHKAKEIILTIIFEKEDGTKQEYKLIKTKQDKLVMN